MYYITLNIALYHLEYCSISHHSPDLFYPRNEDRAESYHGNHTPGNHHREEKARVGSGDGHQTYKQQQKQQQQHNVSGGKGGRRTGRGMKVWVGGMEVLTPLFLLKKKTSLRK